MKGQDLNPNGIEEVVLIRHTQGTSRDRRTSQLYPPGTVWKGGEIVDRLGSREEAARLANGMGRVPRLLVTVYNGERDEADTRKGNAIRKKHLPGAGAGADPMPALPEGDAVFVALTAETAAQVYDGSGEAGSRGSLQKLGEAQVRSSVSDEEFAKLPATLQNGGWLLVTDDGVFALFNHKKAATEWRQTHANWRAEQRA